MDICSLLTISANHISLKTFETMEDGYVYATYYPAEDSGEVYGFFVRTDSAWPDESIPEDLKACIDFAAAHDCTWLRLDINADHISELPTYDWV